MRYNPNVLFKLANYNPIIRRGINYWINGDFDLLHSLYICLTELEKQCFNLVEEYKLDINLKDLLLIPDLFDKTDLEKQHEYIRCIVLTDNTYCYIRKLVNRKQETRIPVVIQNTVTGEVTFSYKDEVENENIT